MAHDVFISYAAEDKAIADAACAKLEEKKIRCWIAPRDVHAGDWPTQIMRALEACRLVVLVFSAHANQSKDVRREIQIAFSKEKFVIPMRIDGVPLSEQLSYFLVSIHWLDAITPPIESHLKKLVADVAWQLNAPKPEERLKVDPTLVDDSAWQIERLNLENSQLRRSLVFLFSASRPLS